MQSSARDIVPGGDVRVRALIPGLLRSYTGGAARVDLALAPGATVDAALRALDERYRGFRFRIVDEAETHPGFGAVPRAMSVVRHVDLPLVAGVVIVVVVV